MPEAAIWADLIPLKPKCTTAQTVLRFQLWSGGVTVLRYLIKTEVDWLRRQLLFVVQQCISELHFQLSVGFVHQIGPHPPALSHHALSQSHQLFCSTQNFYLFKDGDGISFNATSLFFVWFVCKTPDQQQDNMRCSNVACSSLIWLSGKSTQCIQTK